MNYFSHSEVPSLCLRDVERTLTFRQAIDRVVRPGDIVVDAGAGSGILSLMAARAGASKVYAVDVEPNLCERLRETVSLNGLQNIVEVVCADIRDLKLPVVADVILCEMIETWLLDEHQIPALQQLREQGICGPRTRLIPHRYHAFISFGHVDFCLYGFQIPFPIHDWPDLDEQGGWLPIPFQPLTPVAPVFDIDFGGPPPPPRFEASVCVMPTESGIANAVCLSGIVHLGGELTLAQTAAFNGNKLLPISPVPITAKVPCVFHISGVRGAAAGLGSWTCVAENHELRST